VNRAARRRRAREIGKGLDRRVQKAIAAELKQKPEPVEAVPGRKIITLPWGLHIVKYDQPK
jgi:hypothetical protein